MNLIKKAIEVAATAHDKQYRKVSKIPYISHPFGVGMILLQTGCSDEVVAAGILHDVIEDTELTYQDVETLFSKEVAEIVKGCSEPYKSKPWEERKQHSIEYIKNAPLEIKLVSCADKLHNIMSTYEALIEQGELIWDVFKRGKDQQKWYYVEMKKSIEENLDEKWKHSDLIANLNMYVKLVFGD